MRVDKMSISLDADLGAAIRDAARRAGRGVSGWLADAAADRLRAEALAAFLDEWEREHGALTPDELARAEQDLRKRPWDPTA
jgi:hypothetical protein